MFLHDAFVDGYLLLGRSPSAGKSILPVKEFSVEETENQVITFRCTDTSGETATAVYTIRSVSR